eukprot:EG_transcript_38460
MGGRHGREILPVLPLALLATLATVVAIPVSPAPALIDSHDDVHMGWRCLRHNWAVAPWQTPWTPPTPACGNGSNASVPLRYPADAEAHFLEVHDALGAWTRNRPRLFTTRKYAGQRLENLWVAEGWRRYAALRGPAGNATFLSTFGPATSFLPSVRRVLRPDVP